MKRLDSLPDHALLLIVQELTIDDFFSLRQTNRALCTLISSFEQATTLAVAKRTFPNARLLLRPPQDGRYTIQWLKGLIPKQLAAIVVDRYRFGLEGAMGQRRGRPGTKWPPYGIPAEDLLGDHFRARIGRGWCVFKTFSNISQAVYAMHATEIPRLPIRLWLPRLKLGHSNPELMLIRRLERLILERRLRYLRSLARADVTNYYLLRGLLRSAFLTKHDMDPISLFGPYRTFDGKPEPPEDDYFDWGGDRRRSVLELSSQSWVDWFILHKGPTLFWKQWRRNSGSDFQKSGSLIHDELLRAWSVRGQGVEIRRECVDQLDRELWLLQEWPKGSPPPSSHEHRPRLHMWA